MRLGRTGILLTLLFGGLTGHLWAQAGSTAGMAKSSSREPYKAEFKRTTVQTLADGTTITHETVEVTAKDSQGRMVTVTTMKLDGNGKEWTSTMVTDPVEGTHTRWGSGDTKATVWKSSKPGECGAAVAGGSMTTTPVRDEGAAGGVQTGIGSGSSVVAGITMSNGGTSDRLRPSSTKQDLGVTSIQGVQARGRRTVTTTPVGMVGNDRPLLATVETWWATDTGLTGTVVRQVTDDLRFGHSVRELVSMTPGEPEASMFAPPEGFQVEEVKQHPAVCAGSGAVK